MNNRQELQFNINILDKEHALTVIVQDTTVKTPQGKIYTLILERNNRPDVILARKTLKELVDFTDGYIKALDKGMNY